MRSLRSCLYADVPVSSDAGNDVVLCNDRSARPLPVINKRDALTLGAAAHQFS